MRIRTGEPGDHAFLVRAVEALQRELVEIDPIGRMRCPPGHGEAWVAELAKRGAFFLVAEDPDAIGVVTAHVRDGAGVIEDLWVAPDRRRSGVGRALVAAAEAELVARGCAWCTLDVFAPNLAGRAFWRRLGWQDRAVILGRALVEPPRVGGAAATMQRLEDDLAAGRIDETGWHRAMSELVVSRYLAATNPRAQSGHSGDEAHWRQARSPIVDALDRDGAFLDVGCANGHLLECLVAWAAERGRRIEPHGLDLSPDLVALARTRLPEVPFHVGNAISWMPPRRYDFVRTCLEYVPERRRADLVRHLLEHVVEPGGRLIVGVFNEVADGPRLEDRVRGWGFPVRGRTERPHFRDPRLRYRAFWIEAPRLFRCRDHRVVPWKNGRGTTTEIGVHPPGATLRSGFDWRLSMAAIVEDGPFSSFPGIDRTLLVLHGEVELSGLGRLGRHALARFPGEREVSARVPGGPVRDLNLMVRREAFGHDAELVPVDGGTRIGEGHRLVVAVDGEVAVAGFSLAPGEALAAEGPLRADGHGTLLVARLIRIVRRAAHRVLPWGNGLGSSTEIAAWPSSGAWDWRLSIAPLPEGEQLCAMPGLDRVLVPLEGHRQHEVVAIAGDHAVDVGVGGGPVPHLHLLVRRTAFSCSAEVVAVRGRTELGEGHPMLLVALSGSPVVGGVALAPTEAAITAGPLAAEGEGTVFVARLRDAGAGVRA